MRQFLNLFARPASGAVLLAFALHGFAPFARAADPEEEESGKEAPEAPAQEGEFTEKPPAARDAKVSEGQQARYRNLELFQKVLHFVESNYVDEVKNDSLIQGAIKGMLETLDPHSNFLSAEIFKDMKIDTSGKFGGLGIEIGLRDGILTVIAPIEDTPAWRAGLKPGDRIVKIDGDSTKGMSLVEAVAKMRGKKGSKVTVSIWRRGFKQIKEVAILRDIIKIRAVKSEKLEPGFPYIRLSTFNEDSGKDMRSEVERYEKDGPLRGLVFDMRNTPGGLLDQAVEISSMFLEGGVIVSTVGRNKDQKEVKHVIRGTKSWTGFPIAILVNSSTASAAEIVAGALQDHHRAILMGQPTFGKGSVQTVIDLGDSMGLKLTIARYYTPGGRSIQEKGLEPDIRLEEFDPKLLAKAKITRDTLRERDLKGHITGQAEEGGAVQYSMDELDTAGKKDKKDGDPAAPSDEVDDEMEPAKFDPRADYQVQEALNYLKSYEIFKKLAFDKKAS